MTEKVLLEKKLTNGMRVTFFDESKKVAADRWLVRIRCEAVLVPADEMFPNDAEGELRQEFMEKYGAGVRHDIVRDRHFIDARDRDAVRDDLLQQLVNNAFAYLGGARFPGSLLEKKFADFRQERELARRMSELAGEEDEEDGPADFSFCFRD
ncbi:MAG: hypothetical protein AB1427_21965 [Thermodesulfobacteriota bacterium]